ncbi:integrator complex assembly factor WDR73 isoform X2 [Scleropages formosus]|uniref:WD repeat domain 73 n=1 Tax=Scleropages formosus TaxID=113540 RepID=A0A8C9RH34_SCLFO|nr:WD repeat-containing protein 73 isoform X2 [Scleropages formosus]
MDEQTEEDDWFIESLHMYTDLHVFELQDPTRVIGWTSDKSVCVAGYKAAKVHEILELLLPQKLSAKDNQGLCPERDFKVLHGGFSEDSVNCLTHISGTRCVVTSGDPGSSLHLWHIGGEDCDVLKKIGDIHLKTETKSVCKLASGVAGAPSVLHGSQISDIELTDLTSRKLLYTAGEDASDKVSGLQFVDASVFVVCTDGGDLCLGDVRDPSGLRRVPLGEHGGSHWCMDLKKDGVSCSVARLSSSSQVVVSDLRDLRSAFSQAQLNIQPENTSCEFLSVTWAPVLDNCLAVSGLDGLVHIYDTTSWRPDSSEAPALFVHRGHVMSPGSEADAGASLVTTHVWHPWRPRTLLSAAMDGSLHVWDWVEKRTTS